MFFIIPLSFIGRASYLSWVTPNLTIWDALLKVSSDYITGGIFAGSLLVSLVTSVMELKKIPDFFYLFSILYKHINLPNKIGLGGGEFVNMMEDGASSGDKNPSNKSDGYEEAKAKLDKSINEANIAALNYEKEAMDLHRKYSRMQFEKKGIPKRIQEMEALSRKDKILALILAKRDRNGEALYDVFSEASTKKKDECRRLAARIEHIDKQFKDDVLKFEELMEKRLNKNLEARSLEDEINSLNQNQSNNSDN